jgi:hypothetical protein
MRITLADIKASRIPESVNCPPSDSRIIHYVNEAVERLIKKGHWWGTTAKYSLYASSGLITLPRQIATIEKIAVSHHPIPVRDFWYEWLDNGWGTRDDTSGTNECLFQRRVPLFSDFVPDNKKANVICDLSSDLGKPVLVLGYDDIGNWIRTVQDGVMADGEVVLLAQTPGTLSSNKFSVVSDIQAPDDLEGQWWMYEYDTVRLTQRLVGNFQYDEVRPSYARYFVPSIGTDAVLVEVLAKLDFIPVRVNTDYVLLGNIPALKLMCMAIKAEEDKQYTEAMMLEAKALRELNAELDHYLGDGRTSSIHVVGSSIGENDPIYTPL